MIVRGFQQLVLILRVFIYADVGSKIFLIIYKKIIHVGVIGPCVGIIYVHI